MKQFCKISGVLLQTSNHFHNLLKSKEFYSLSAHQIFEYKTARILDFATRKPIESFTSEERHLLTLALLYSHGNFLVSYPIAPGRIEDAFIFSHFRKIIESSLSIASMQTVWNRAISAREAPYLHVTEGLVKSNSLTHTLKEWVTNIIPSTLNHIRNQNNRRDLADIWSDVELERQLKKELIEERLNNRKYNKYTPQMGIYVLNKIKQVDYKDAREKLTVPFLYMCESVLKTSVPAAVKYPISAVTEIIEFIDQYLNPQSNHNQKAETEWKNPLDRNYILFTLSYLHSVIQYFHDLDSLFSNITDQPGQVQKQRARLLSKEFNTPVDFTIIRTVTGPERIEIDDRKSVSQSPAMQRLLEKIRKHNQNVDKIEKELKQEMQTPAPIEEEKSEIDSGSNNTQPAIESSIFE